MWALPQLYFHTSDNIPCRATETGRLCQCLNGTYLKGYLHMPNYGIAMKETAYVKKKSEIFQATTRFQIQHEYIMTLWVIQDVPALRLCSLQCFSFWKLLTLCLICIPRAWKVFVLQVSIWFMMKGGLMNCRSTAIRKFRMSFYSTTLRTKPRLSQTSKIPSLNITEQCLGFKMLEAATEPERKRLHSSNAGVASISFYCSVTVALLLFWILCPWLIWKNDLRS